MIYVDGDFANLIVPTLHHKLMEEAPQVDTGHWQSLKDVPHTATRELFRVCMETPIPQTQEDTALWVQPNLPWAEDHFQERVAGEPTNPGKEYMNWPWYSPSWAAQGGRERTFSHTYQERMWPRHAPQGDRSPLQTQSRLMPGENFGLRYRYGDLNDVVNLLAREPTTRQAYLPIWFPEDTGAHHGERVPCTLGYHFILRGGLLHCTYHIRSCDFLRYFRDDVYMAMRLTHWMLDNVAIKRGETILKDYWAAPGILQMNITSLHIFENDMSKMRRTAPATP